VEYQVISQFNSLANQFLIAMPQMLDPNFSGTLTYICEHNEEGAMGIIINRPIKVGLNDILLQLDMPIIEKSQPICWGGPVQEDRGFIIHTVCSGLEKPWESSMEISKGINLTSSKDIIKAIAEDRGPEKFIIALGYAGWGSGQLEQELAENTWLCSPANEALLFDVNVNQKRTVAINSLGITEHQLNAQIGHA
jgi:putative transcriptional regulator